ncbi:MAG: XdhC family protein [Pseudomonadales bacterium]|nr:XdhC family protein [Pseudomonadales bacterium]
MSLEAEVLAALLAWLDKGESAFLCTVTSTWGSSPRPVGSLMACTKEGLQAGSLSGGCVEEALLASLASGFLVCDEPVFIRYGETTEEQQCLQLPCGGTLGVFIEPVKAGGVFHQHIAEIVNALQQRKLVRRIYNYVSRHFICGVPETEREAENNESASAFFDFENIDKGSVIRHCYGPQFHLFLIGVSEVSRALARFALLMDYRVTVCDSRAEQIARWNIAGARAVCAMPDELLLKEACDPRSAIIALAHDPRVDDMGLMEAFNTDAFFIGAMGSLRTSEARRLRLLELGVTEAQLNRLHAPVGMMTGSKTPAEIAVSILAQLTSVRNGVSH